MMTKKIIAMKNYLRMRNEGLKEFLREEDGVGVVEVILILVGICIADKSRILCGNFRCI